MLSYGSSQQVACFFYLIWIHFWICVCGANIVSCQHSANGLYITVLSFALFRRVSRWENSSVLLTIQIATDKIKTVLKRRVFLGKDEKLLVIVWNNKNGPKLDRCWKREGNTDCWTHGHYVGKYFEQPKVGTTKQSYEGKVSVFQKKILALFCTFYCVYCILTLILTVEDSNLLIPITAKYIQQMNLAPNKWTFL